MIEAVIFDCDGTLVDSERLCFQALVEGLAARGVTVDADALDQQYAGCNLEGVLRELGERHGVELGEAFLASMSAREREIARTELRPIDGVEAVLAGLTLPRCVASNAPLEKMRFSLGHTGLLPHFGEALHSAYCVQAWKPDPTLFLHAARALGVRPEACVVVEDSVVGATAGVSAGMRTLFYNPREKAVPEGCEGFGHMALLLELIKA